jgi:hypothetical protein
VATAGASVATAGASVATAGASVASVAGLPQAASIMLATTSRLIIKPNLDFIILLLTYNMVLIDFFDISCCTFS